MSPKIKAARQAATARYMLTPKGKALLRRVHLKGHYGITVEEYERRYKAQSGRCKICRRLFPLLCVDHKNKIIRGLLCKLCNTAIGLLQDSPENLRRATRYLVAANS